MKFNLYFDNKTKIKEDILKSDVFKQNWKKCEISALKQFYGEKASIRKN